MLARQMGAVREKVTVHKTARSHRAWERRHETGHDTGVLSFPVNPLGVPPFLLDAP